VLCPAVPAELQRRPGLHLLCPQPQRGPGGHPGHLPGLVPRHARLGGEAGLACSSGAGSSGMPCQHLPMVACCLPLGIMAGHGSTSRSLHSRPPAAPGCSCRRARRAARPPLLSWQLLCRATSSSCTAATVEGSSTSLVRTAHPLSSYSSCAFGATQCRRPYSILTGPPEPSRSATLHLCCSRQAAQFGTLLRSAADGLQQRAPAGAAALRARRRRARLPAGRWAQGLLAALLLLCGCLARPGGVRTSCHDFQTLLT
jgi:hypothetical protein